MRQNRTTDINNFMIQQGCRKNTRSLRSFYFIFILIQALLTTSCDFNILGGSKSKISDGYNPGLHTISAPPTISAFTDLVIDENDSITVPFIINDPDTFLFCSGINIAVRSTQPAVLGSADMVIAGSYPNCTLKINSHSVTKTTDVKLTVEVTDYWSTVGASFNVTVRRVEKPGAFQITAHEGLRKSFIVNWSNADYMDGSSARYYLYFKKIGNQNLTPGAFTGVIPTYIPSPAASQTSFVEVKNVRSPAWIVDAAYELENSTVYEVYITARNAFNLKNPTVLPTETQHVFIRTLDQYQFKVREFVSSSRQDYLSPAVDHGGDCSSFVVQAPGNEPCSSTTDFFVQASMGSPMERTVVPTASSRYKVYLNAQGLMYGVDP